MSVIVFLNLPIKYCNEKYCGSIRWVLIILRMESLIYYLFYFLIYFIVLEIPSLITERIFHVRNYIGNCRQKSIAVIIEHYQ
jgi:hypothetical protein